MPVICLKHVREDQRLGVLMEVEDEKAQFLSGFRDRMGKSSFLPLSILATSLLHHPPSHLLRLTCSLRVVASLILTH